MAGHKERAHSKYSASGFERIAACPGCAALSEGLPNKTNEYAEEGTRAHEVLETIVRAKLVNKKPKISVDGVLVTQEMISHGNNAADKVFSLYKKADELLVEEKLDFNFIHPEAGGTLDYSVLSYFDTLDILDYKFGKTLVSPIGNLQFIFYALGVAHKYDWNFKTVRMWTLQPRVKNFDGFPFWEIPMTKLMKYVPKFKAIIKRAEQHPEIYVEGDHCFFCKAKGKCPLKQDKRFEKIASKFANLN